ncbi:hypothetical protein [Microbacterium thalassium]|uniref:PilN domain-containing protein n=1 Tax=Microbacterium thalassium TaxID=362649 RepID=A0A7X0KUX7_9MICO|nr:hypothetical protein [Microbacterium thalassium]MBB6391636.1 hypothetical protein [Microbacterium thalassium]GLK24239.1 hypothetical protein GCM10017607_15570 [Microbacterium thalassium]
MTAAIPAVPFGGVPRVNLIPRSEIERRQRDATLRGWVWGIGGAVLAAVLVIAGALALNWFADQRLAAEQARTNDLLVELATLSDVSTALSTERDLTSFRAESMGSDFAWSPVIDSLESTMPGEVSLIGFNLIAGGVPQGEDPALEPGLIGTLTLSSPNVIDIAQTVRSMRSIDGVIDADGSLVATSSSTVGQYTYELSITFDQSIYSGRYLETEGGE